MSLRNLRRKQQKRRKKVSTAAPSPVSSPYVFLTTQQVYTSFIQLIQASFKTQSQIRKVFLDFPYEEDWSASDTLPIDLEGKTAMAPINQAIQLLYNGNRQQMQKLLLLAILETEDEMLELDPKKLDQADRMKLSVTEMEDGKIVLVAVPR